MQKEYDLLSIGTMYIDFDFLAYPFIDGLMTHKETVGKEYELAAGGSALTFARICSKLELKPVFIGKTGKDEMATVLKHLVEQSGVKPAIVQDPDVSTNVAVHYVREDGASIMTSSGTANQSISIEDVRSAFEQYANSIDFLYLGGVFKMKTLLPHYEEIILKAKEHGVRVVLDHGRVNNGVSHNDIDMLRHLLQFIDIYLPSKDEFLSVWSSNTIEEGLKKVRATSSATTVVKNSEDGAIGLRDNEMIHVPAFSVNVLNTVGAGDSFNAGFIKGISEGRSLKESMLFACATAATKISSVNSFSLKKVMELFSTNR